MKRAVLAAVLLACKATPSAPPPPPADAGSIAALDASDSKALLAEVDRMKDRLEDKPRSFEVLSALGNLYYENGRYLEAVDAYRQAEQMPAPALESGLSVSARLGNALYLTGNPAGALAQHQKVLSRSRDYPESLFFVGAILMERSNGDKKQIAEGKKYWERLLKVAPDSPRATIVRQALPNVEEMFKPRIAEVPEPTPEEMRNLQEAVSRTERTPELEKGLDQLVAEGEQHLDAGRYQEARDAVVRVMPMRPDDARTAAALGGAMRGLGRTEMARRTLARALQLDPRQPRALYEMGKLSAEQGDAAAARRNFTQLKAVDPRFARTHKVDEELAKLK